MLNAGGNLRRVDLEYSDRSGTPCSFFIAPWPDLQRGMEITVPIIVTAHDFMELPRLDPEDIEVLGR